MTEGARALQGSKDSLRWAWVGLGAGGAVAGASAVGGGALIVRGVIARDSTADALLGMVGGFGIQFGVGATGVDLGTELSAEIDRMECG